MRRAVCILVQRNRGDEVLMVTHKNSQGKFIFPGGKVEDGETSIEAARRELVEETGLGATLRLVMEMPSDGRPLGYDFTFWTSFYAAIGYCGEPHDRESQTVKWGSWDELLQGPYGELYREMRSRL